MTMRTQTRKLRFSKPMEHGCAELEQEGALPKVRQNVRCHEPVYSLRSTGLPTGIMSTHQRVGTMQELS